MNKLWRLRLVFVAISVVFLLIEVPLKADCNCDGALRKDIIKIVHTESQATAFLQTIDHETYDLMKTGGGFGLTIPVVDSLVKASGSWDEFKENRTKYLQTISYTSTAEAAWDEFRTVSSPIQYTAWIDCMRLCAERGIGFYGWKEMENEDVIVYTVYFHGPPGAKPSKLSGKVVHGAFEPNGATELPRGETIKSNAKKTYLVLRTDKTQRVTLKIEAEDYGAVVIDSKWAQPGDESVGRIRLFRSERTVVDKGVITRQFVSPERHEKPAFRNSFVIVAGNGRKLKDVAPPAYIGPAPEVQDTINKLRSSPLGLQRQLAEGLVRAWAGVGHFSKLVDLTISSDSSACTAVLDTWSRTGSWQMRATEYEEIFRPIELTNKFNFTVGKPFRVTVPVGFDAALLEVDFDGGAFVIRVGESSHDGAIQKQTTVPAGPGGTVYQYVVSRKPDPPSVEDVLNTLLLDGALQPLVLPAHLSK